MKQDLKIINKNSPRYKFNMIKEKRENEVETMLKKHDSQPRIKSKLSQPDLMALNLTMRSCDSETEVVQNKDLSSDGVINQDRDKSL